MPRSSRHIQLLSIALLALAGQQEMLANDGYSEASQLYQAGNWKAAAAAFDRLAQDSLQSEATRLAAQLYAGESLMQQGDYLAARQRYLVVQQHHPPARLAAQALFRLGEAAWLAGEHEEAATLLQSYIEQYPLGASTTYAREYLQQIRGRESSAADFAKLDEAVGWERDGRNDAALAAYHGILKQHLDRDPIRSETLRRAARLHDRLEQAHEALACYQQFLAEFPSSEHAADAMSATAWLHDRLHQTAQAADQFRGVHAKFPQSAQAVEAAYWLALYHSDKDERDLATQYVDWLLGCEQGSSERPKLWAKALCLKSLLLSHAQQWEPIETLVATEIDRVQAHPLRAKLEFWAAEAAFRQRNYKVARERYHALEPSVIGINQSWTAMVPLRRAQLSARRQQWSEVLRLLDQLERDHPEFEFDYEIDYLRGRALAGRGNMTAARKYYRAVLENEAATGTEAATMAGWMIGETYFHQRDYARARAAYEQVMNNATLTEWQSRAALQAGKCWELEQLWETAAEVYSSALQNWPHSSSEQELESRLRWARSQSTAQR